MASSRLSKLALLLALVALLRGTISAVKGDTVTVAGKQIRVGDRTELLFMQPIVLGDIKPGSFLAVTSQKGPGGQLTALEIRVQPKPISPGHRPFDGKSDQTMTNATVGAMVQATSGRELTMTYDGGSQKITVPESASVSALVPGNRSQLVPGAAVNLTANPGDGGKLTAIRIQVSPPR